ncbi:hypothetical protein ANFP_06510 [Acidithiobacillus ferrooxidans]|nr:hypothetical protein ANFP_06510 [Acidithiobacillus ferrooxidans]
MNYAVFITCHTGGCAFPYAALSALTTAQTPGYNEQPGGQHHDGISAYDDETRDPEGIVPPSVFNAHLLLTFSQNWDPGMVSHGTGRTDPRMFAIGIGP